ncbi:MAG: hypothetical protein LBH06_04335 [Rikenellaceae bacterium]|jgi:cell division protein FtsQ|nr:hypothetical protein [Rikenellaceae bacterium]
MKKLLLTVASVVAWVAIGAYLVAAVRMCNREKEGMKLANIRVVIEDSARMKIVTPAMVRGWLAGAVRPGMDMGRINTSELRQTVLEHLFVSSARVYTNLRGELVVKLTQRRPIARVSLDNGYNFYITDDYFVLPPQSHETVYVPVITGVFTPPFARDFVGEMAPLVQKEKKLPENYIFTSKLINFVKFIEGDDFWRSEIVQICVVGSGREPQIEIVPRSGRHVVAVGAPDDVEKKMDKLLAFYRRALRYEGWESYGRIDIRFEGQVVCTKNGL